MGNGVRWALRHDLQAESDEQLTDRARNGDRSAFGELYRRHRKAAESTARCLLRSRADADDVVSDAFAGVLSALRNGSGPRDNFRCYLLACVRNGCRVRRMPPVPVSDEHLEVWSPALEDPERYVEADTVARAFSSLTPRWQHTLWLTEVEQQPPSEVSARLQLSPNATAALAHRARQAFATAYLAEHVAAVTDKDCAQAAPQLAGYVRNQLPVSQRDALERHLVGCTHCSRAVAELRDLNASLRSLLPAVPATVAGTALVAAESALVATTIGGATLGLPGAGVWLKGLVAVLVVAPVLTTDVPKSEGRSGQSAESVVEVRQADAASGAAIGSPEQSTRATAVSAATDRDPQVAVAGTEPERPEPIAAPPLVSAPHQQGSEGQAVATPTPAATITIPAVTEPDPLVDLVDDVVDVVRPVTDDVVRPVVGAITEPVIVTADEVLDLIGLGATGETVTLLRSLVPLLNGLLVGMVLDELLGIASVVPADGSTPTTVSGSGQDPASGGLGDVPPPSSYAAAPSVTGIPSAGSSAPPAASAGSSPPVTTPTWAPGILSSIALPTVSEPAIVPPTISIPPISIPIVSPPPITLPVISIPPVTLPNILG